MFNFAKGTIAGLISGVFLGLFLKFIESVTSVKVYMLLLNVDYIPILNNYRFPEIVEFMLHLIISMILAVLLLYLIAHDQWAKNQVVIRTISISILIGILLYPTTAFSERTPALNSMPAIVFWLIGHLLYGWVLSLFFKEKRPSS
ncbi:hypothetical protein [Cytobacillus sp. NCCP-133]|uniref:hypothetical protein n=1 Tax=Cytobacillus sp. NCCP-133 TaxID=766848 RepID=UPI00222F6FF6|nr:hypothetical protein [Cytobacillus sp. NCCP-133]GLB59776.1 hypothetical protein NCCP133_19080 [Cytobacillus sp. NCCP-133]